MNTMVVTLLHTIAELANYALAYHLIFRAKLSMGKKAIISWFAVFVVAAIFAQVFDKSVMQDVVMVGGIVIPFIWIKKRSMKWLLIYPSVVMYVSIVSIAISYIVAYLLNVRETEVVEYDSVVLICGMCTFLIQYGTYLWFRRTGRLEKELVVTKVQYALFYVGVYCSFILVACTQLLSSSEPLPTQIQNMFGFCVVIVCLVFVLLGVWNSVIMHNEAQYKAQVAMYELYMQQQEQHIKTIINNDEQLRSYRHDMKSHLQVMQSYCDKNENEDLKKYFDMLLGKREIFETTSYTGNTAVDAILHNAETQAKENNIEIIKKVQLPGELSVSVFDLCVILSNLFQNAIEACKKCSQEKRIEIVIYPNDNKLYIVVKNTVHTDVIIEDNRLVTTKNDKLNHGFGSKNVKAVVEKYNGHLNYSCKEKEFSVEIYM